MDTEVLLEALRRLPAGLPLTLQLVFLSLAAGLALAIGVALMRLSPHPAVSGLAYGYVFVFRGTPLLVQIFLIYFGLGQLGWIREGVLWPVLREPFACAVLALTLNTAAYTAEILRGGILAVPRGAIEAARACGMPPGLAFRRITLPLALRQALPAYGNEMILMVKASSLASTITLMEVTGIAGRLISRTFAPVEVFIVAGALYLLLNFALTGLVRWAEGRLGAPAPQARGHGDARR